MYSNIVGETEPEFPSCIGEDAKDLILGLLRKDSARRFGEKQIKCHPFFSTIDWDRLRKRGYEMPYHSYVVG